MNGRYNGNMPDGAEDRIIPPASYSGSAIRTPEALSEAEEAFRRGYVFEKHDGIHPNTEYMPNENGMSEEADELISATDRELPMSAENDIVHIGAEASEASSEAEKTAVSVSAGGSIQPPQKRGFISGIFEKLTAEHLILIAVILILLDSRADDELLIMLVILLFC